MLVSFMNNQKSGDCHMLACERIHQQKIPEQNVDNADHFDLHCPHFVQVVFVGDFFHKEYR